MSDFTVPAPTAVEIPKTHERAKKENPFSQFFPTEMGDSGKALSWTFPHKTDADETTVKKVVNLIRAAGKDKGVTNRVKVTPDGKGKVVVTAWSVERIERKRKGSDS